MGKKKKKKDEVEVIELEEIKHPKRRLVLVIILMLMSAGFFAYGVLQAINHTQGIDTIDVVEKLPYAADYVCQYELGKDANAEFRAVSKLYTASLKKGYEIFTNVESADYKNIYYLNQHLNETVLVEPELYWAISEFYRNDSRELFMAPVYYEYDKLFMCTEDWETGGLNPYDSPELKSYIDEVMKYVSDPQHIDIAFGSQQEGIYWITVNVSEEYLKFADDNGIEIFVDFYRYRNAFILDLINQSFKDNGLTKSYLATADGYNACGSHKFSTLVVNRSVNVVREAADLEYTGPVNIVTYHSYTLNDNVGDFYYEYDDGRVAHGYIDESDGLYRNSIDDLIVYSYKESLARTALSSRKCFIAEKFDLSILEGLNYVYTQNQTVHYNDSLAKISNLYDKDGITYRVQKD